MPCPYPYCLCGESLLFSFSCDSSALGFFRDMRIRTQLGQSLRARPRRQGLPVGQRLEFANPNFALQDKRHIGTAKIFMPSELDGSLTDLNCIVLHPDDIRLVVARQILNTD